MSSLRFATWQKAKFELKAPLGFNTQNSECFDFGLQLESGKQIHIYIIPFVALFFPSEGTSKRQKKGRQRDWQFQDCVSVLVLKNFSALVSEGSGKIKLKS